MGRKSDKQRSAQRPGRRERARVKKQRQGRSQAIVFVPGAGTIHVKFGRKKMDRFFRAYLSHQLVASTSKAGNLANGQAISQE